MQSSVPDENARRFAVDVVKQLRTTGFVALWAGGCVRDLLMGNASDDYDVATSATPEQVRELFGHRHTLAVGAAFGVIIVLPADRQTQPVEVATFRRDTSYSDGRRPDAVVFSTAEEDAQRRDFTINGMFYDPIVEEVIDYVGGQEDLRRGVIRAIGTADERIAEDKLRMLRAIRFAARFGFSIEDETRSAIARHAATLKVVSGERIAIEIQKTLVSRKAAWGIGEWASSGLLSVFLPELDWDKRSQAVEQLVASVQSIAPKWHELTKDWRIAMAAMLWAGLDAETRASTTDALRERLRWSNDDSQCIAWGMNVQPTLETSPQRPWSEIQPLLVQPYATQAVQLLMVRSYTAPTLCDAVAWLRERLVWPRAQLDPAPLLDGQDLIDMGWKPGPEFKRLIAEARRMQLDHQLRTHDEAVAWANSQLP